MLKTGKFNEIRGKFCKTGGNKKNSQAEGH